MSDEPCLILKRFRYGESSLVVHVLGRNTGRAHLLAKGAYRPTSGYCGVLDLFDTLAIDWRARPGELAPVRGARLTTRRPQLSRNLERYRSALAVLELLDLACPGPPEPRAFDLACAALDQLNDVDGPARKDQEQNGPSGALQRWVLPAFDLQLLGALGLEPALERCAACGREAPPVDQAGLRAAFSAGAGGRLCLSCAHEARASGRRVGTLPVTVLAVAAQLLRSGQPARAVDDGLGAAVRDFVRRFLEYHLETRPRSRQAPRPTRARSRRTARASTPGPTPVPGNGERAS